MGKTRGKNEPIDNKLVDKSSKLKKFRWLIVIGFVVSLIVLGAWYFSNDQNNPVEQQTGVDGEETIRGITGDEEIVILQNQAEAESDIQKKINLLVDKANLSANTFNFESIVMQLDQLRKTYPEASMNNKNFLVSYISALLYLDRGSEIEEYAKKFIELELEGKISADDVGQQVVEAINEYR